MSEQAPNRPTGPGLVQVYTGDGKGKTTAALGLAVRAAGWGYRTFIGQFMKAQDSGERLSLAHLAPYITIEPFGQPRFIRESREEDMALAHRGLERIREVLASGEYQIIILDEICVSLHFKLVTVAEVLELIDQRPAGTELILTGRRAPQEILDRADLITEMVMVKHPYERGIVARRGIEF